MKKKKFGFTLIELILALALTVTVLGISSSMFITGNKVFSDSDVKSTLQIEGQAIQEKISNIGMQATGIVAVSGDSHSNELNNITISAYDGNEPQKDFTLRIEEDTGKKYKDNNKVYKLMIDGKVISSNIESFKIDNSIITASNTASLKNINSINFNIKLRKENGYSNVEHVINFAITFRNK